MEQSQPLPDRDPQADADRRPPLRAFNPEAQAQAADPLGVDGLFDQAIGQPVRDLAHAEQLKAAICGRLKGICPEMAPWAAIRAAELVVDGGCEPRLIGKACADFLAVTKKKNPPGLLQHLLAKHFGEAWSSWWNRPEAE